MRLQLKDITFSHTGAPPFLFNRLSLTLQGPGFLSLFGLSGCGKSTLSRIIAGLTHPRSGGISSNGHRILYMHNNERLPYWMPLQDHLRQVAPSGRFQDGLALAAEMGIDTLLSTSFPNLSLGQKNRANLLRYLVQDFDMLIIDEALANVDEPSRETILSSIKNHFPKRTFLYISHNVTEVAFFSKEIFVFPSISEHGISRLRRISGLDGSGSPSSMQEAVTALGHKIVALCTGVSP